MLLRSAFCHGWVVFVCPIVVESARLQGCGLKEQEYILRSIAGKNVEKFEALETGVCHKD